MRRYEEYSHRERNADRCCTMTSFQAQKPAGCRANQQSHEGKSGGQAKRGKRRPCEVEEVRHRERVAAYIAVGEQCANVGDEWEIARLPEPPAKRYRSEDSGHGEDRLCPR